MFLIDSAIAILFYEEILNGEQDVIDDQKTVQSPSSLTKKFLVKYGIKERKTQYYHFYGLTYSRGL